MKKLMILGASYSQLPLYEAEERLSIKTIAASTPGDWPGFQAADESTYTDISDPGAVMEAVRKFQEISVEKINVETFRVPGSATVFCRQRQRFLRFRHGLLQYSENLR